MTVSFLEMLGGDSLFLPATAEPDMPTASSDYQPESSAVCRKLPQNVPHQLTDGEREAAIGLAASLIEHHVELYEISGCFTDRANADRARLAMEALIAGRSPRFKSLFTKAQRESGPTPFSQGPVADANQHKESHDEQA